MLRWIISEKRYAEPWEQTTYCVTWWVLRDGVNMVEGEYDCIDDSEKHAAFVPVLSAARRLARAKASLPRNHFQTATIERCTLDHVDGNAFDWDPCSTAEREEVYGRTRNTDGLKAARLRASTARQSFTGQDPPR